VKSTESADVLEGNYKHYLVTYIRSVSGGICHNSCECCFG